MYKCTDCGCEYEIKPEYCDCGNNIFTEILSEEKPSVKRESLKTSLPKKNKRTLDILGFGIFIFCIISAILVILFFGNDIIEKANQNTEKTTVLQPVKNIPNIDSFWKTTKIEELKQDIIPKPITITTPVKKILIPKTNPQPIKQNVQKQTTTKNTVSKTTQQTQKVNVQKYLSNAQQTQNTKQITQPVTNQTQKTQIQNTTVQTTKTTPTIDTALLQKEYSAYKIDLRNRIAKKIDFTKVVGDGNCAVTFKIDKNGNLINRNFAQQSTNTTLNNAVYNAMLQNPSYQNPPSGYKNETLTLSVRFYGGRFDVTLK